MKVVNKTGYDTGALRKFFRAGLKDIGAELDKKITVVYSHGTRHGGWAYYPCGDQLQGRTIRLTIPKDPANLDLKELALTFEHEAYHTLGLRHADMDEETKLCKGPKPAWAEGLEIPFHALEVAPLSGPVPKEERIARREAHARKLAERWARRLKTAQKQLKKWEAKVRYYERTYHPAAAKPSGGGK